MNSIKVSIIIPVYNNANYLKECLDHLINQTEKNIEIICVNDGSTDNSLEILEEYQKNDSRIIIINQENAGGGAARNTGMKIAKGQYLYFMDSDDYCDVDFLEKACKVADERKTDILVFDFYRFDENGSEYTNGLRRNYLPECEVFSYKEVSHIVGKFINPAPWNKLYNGDFIRNANISWLELSSSNDVTFTGLSVLKANRISYLDEAFLHYRVNHSTSTTSFKRNKQDNVIKALLEYGKQAMSLPHFNEVKNAVSEYVAGAMIWSMKAYMPDEYSAVRLTCENKLEDIFRTHPLFYDIKKDDYIDKNVFNYVYSAKHKYINLNEYHYGPKIIASMTSFPARIDTVYKSLNSVYKQTKMPDKVVLWLAESQFPNKELDLPDNLLEYKQLGLEIEFTKEDIRPHKKYYYAMKKYPNDLIVTLDDDLLYHKEMIELLYNSYLIYPNCISTMRTHLMTLNGNKLNSYNDWIKEHSSIVGKPSMSLFSTSGAGTLYPPNLMHEEVFNINNIKDLCLNADDLWLKVMQIKNNIPVVLVRENRTLKYIDGTQETALLKTNVDQNQNDVQLRKVLDAYQINDQELYEILNTNYEENLYKENLLKQIRIDLEKGYSNSTKELNLENITLKNKIKDLNDTIKNLNVNITNTKKNLNKIKKSKSYKLSRYITYIPRKIKKIIK